MGDAPGVRHAGPVASHVLAAGPRHSLGLLVDGTVASAGAGAAGECRTGDWRDVVAVAAGNVHAARNTGRSHSVGLLHDGSVVATGWNDGGQCEVRAWRRIVAIAAGWRRTLGLRSDGTVALAWAGNAGLIPAPACYRSLSQAALMAGTRTR